LLDTVEPLLELRGVSKEFELAGRRMEALRETHLRVDKGEFVCLIGASGCGKSTLLRIVAGFESPTRGQAFMSGVPVNGPGPERGMVFQDYGYSRGSRYAAISASGRFPAKDPQTR
jgi:NitT/TauT family transport system ATP-binding protein